MKGKSTATYNEVKGRANAYAQVTNDVPRSEPPRLIEGSPGFEGSPIRGLIREAVRGARELSLTIQRVELDPDAVAADAA